MAVPRRRRGRNFGPTLTPKLNTLGAKVRKTGTGLFVGMHGVVVGGAGTLIAKVKFGGGQIHDIPTRQLQLLDPNAKDDTAGQQAQTDAMVAAKDAELKEGIKDLLSDPTVDKSVKEGVKAQAKKLFRKMADWNF